MKFTSMKKYQGILMTGLQTVAILFIAAIVTVFQCGFRFESFNWLSFFLNFGFTTYMKTTYTVFSKNRELATDEIQLLQNTINNDRTEVFNAQKTDAFEKEVEVRNGIKKLEAYIQLLDNKRITKRNKDKTKELRNWAFDYKTALINREDITPYEKQKSLKSVNVYYEKIETSKLFTYGKNHKTRKTKYTFNSFTSSLNRALIPTTISMTVSIALGAIRTDSYIQTGQAWIDLAGYLFSIILGAWWGWTNGKAIIQEDYSEVLNNVAGLIRDIKSKILN